MRRTGRGNAGVAWSIRGPVPLHGIDNLNAMRDLRGHAEHLRR